MLTSCFPQDFVIKNHFPVNEMVVSLKMAVLGHPVWSERPILRGVATRKFSPRSSCF